MSLEHWTSAHVVPAEDLAELERWSKRLRRVAHDINNALVPVVANVDLVRMRMRGLPGAERLALLPTQLLHARETVQRAAAAALRPEPTRSVTPRDIQLSLLGLTRRAHVSLHFGFPEDLPVPLPAHQVRTLLSVLVANSCEAYDTGHAPAQTASPETPPDPATRPVYVWSRVQDGAAWLCVQDEGPGASDMPALLDGSLVRAGGGHLGLGLRTASSLAHARGGELRVKNLPDAGFLNLVRLPLSPGAEG